MNTLVLHGFLEEKYGSRFTLACRTVREFMRAMMVNKPGFERDVEKGEFRVVRTKAGSTDTGIQLGEDTLTLGMSNTDVHLIPVPEGSKKAGLGKVVLGAVLVGAAIVTGGGAAAVAGSLGGFASGSASLSFAAGLSLLGGAMILGGLSTMLLPTPGGLDPNDTEDEAASFVPSGIVNVTGEGQPVFLIYGDTMCSSVVVSSGYSIERIGSFAPEYPNPYDFTHGGGERDLDNFLNVRELF